MAVSRFDRTPDGGLLAVEDASQAMGRYSADTYNLTTEDAGAALGALGTSGEDIGRADGWVGKLDESGSPRLVVTKWRRAVDYRRKRLVA